MTTKRSIKKAPRGRTGTTLDTHRGAARGVEPMLANTARSLHPTARGLELRCVSGLVVVTQEGDRDDHVLYPGDEFRTSRRGRVVAWAMLDSRLTVSSGAGAADTRRAA